MLRVSFLAMVSVVVFAPFAYADGFLNIKRNPDSVQIIAEQHTIDLAQKCQRIVDRWHCEVTATVAGDQLKITLSSPTTAVKKVHFPLEWFAGFQLAIHVRRVGTRVRRSAVETARPEAADAVVFFWNRTEKPPTAMA